jgi:hypothetical protein
MRKEEKQHLGEKCDIEVTVREQWAHDILLCFLDNDGLQSEYEYDDNEQKLVDQAVRIADKLIATLSKK